MKPNRRGIYESAGGIVWREGANGRLLAVVHRPRYDDWSLPKGTLDEGETWQEAAVREVHRDRHRWRNPIWRQPDGSFAEW